MREVWRWGMCSEIEGEREFWDVESSTLDEAHWTFLEFV